MRTFAETYKPVQKSKSTNSVKPCRALSGQSKKTQSSIHSGSSPHFAHDFSPANIRVFPRQKSADTMIVQQLETAGSVHDQDTSAALNGQDVVPEVAPAAPAQSAPGAPQLENLAGAPGGEKQADPAPKEGTVPAKTVTTAGGDGCAKPSDHAGILALMTRAHSPLTINTIAYGFTSWPASAITRPKVAFDWKPSGKKFTGTLKKTTASTGKIEALYLKPGTYKTPKKITARGPAACGKSGKKVDFYSKVDNVISGLAKMGEQEHCNDYERAFDLTHRKWAGIINSVAGTSFGPGSKVQVKAKAAKALKAKGDKGRNFWISESNRLKRLSKKRDVSDHSMKPDGLPKKINATCTRVDGTSVKSTRTKIPGPSSKALIK